MPKFSKSTVKREAKKLGTTEKFLRSKMKEGVAAIKAGKITPYTQVRVELGLGEPKRCRDRGKCYNCAEDVGNKKDRHYHSGYDRNTIDLCCACAGCKNG